MKVNCRYDLHHLRKNFTLELSKLYNVRFRLVDSKKSKGYRLSVYKCAPSCLAYYSSEDKEKSIFYDVNSPTPTDLVVSLVFKAERDALLFQNSLLDLTEKFQHFRDKFVLETHEPSVIHVESCTNLTRVLTSDYDKNENNETHIMSLNDIMSNESTITVYTNTETLLKTLEAEEIVASFDKKWYKCHFIPNDCKLYRNDPNRNHDDNFIWGSRNFHQLFDGLHTVNSGVGVVLRFVRSNPNGEEVLVAPNRYESRYCVFISVEFKNAKVAASFASYFKDGTKRLTDTKYETFIYVKDVNVVQDCLRKKFMFEKEEQEDPWLEEMEYD